jgi:pilus assembly protein Flp/PilA
MKKLTRRGQGMTEYIIIVALIAVATIGIVTLFGNNLRGLFGMAADAIAGETNVAMRNPAGRGGDAALTQRTVKTFAEGNAP